MKIRNLFLAIIASMAAFIACQEEEVNLGTPNIVLSETEISFESAGGEQSLTVTASRDWMVETDADWVVVSPESGLASADAQTVTVTVLENTGLDRSVDVKFTIGMKSKYLTVNQAGPKGSAENLVVYYNDYDKEVAEKTKLNRNRPTTMMRPITLKRERKKRRTTIRVGDIRRTLRSSGTSVSSVAGAGVSVAGSSRASPSACSANTVLFSSILAHLTPA